MCTTTVICTAISTNVLVLLPLLLFLLLLILPVLPLLQKHQYLIFIMIWWVGHHRPLADKSITSASFPVSAAHKWMLFNAPRVMKDLGKMDVHTMHLGHGITKRSEIRHTDID